MDFKERLSYMEQIHKDCPYETQKDKIVELFEKTKDTKKDDILLRLFVIDSCYSTNMNRRLFGFEHLADIILKLNSQLTEKMDIIKFLEKNKEVLFNSKIGIDKKGKPRGHAFSLISKYIYFKTKFNFPIYDRLVYDGLIEEKLIKRPRKPTVKYFKILISLTDKYSISFDELDQYFWILGKIRGGNLSLLISDVNSYNQDFLDRLNLNEKEKKAKSDKFNKILSKKLILEKNLFNNSKLKVIQKLAKSIKNERVFEKELREMEE